MDKQERKRRHDINNKLQVLLFHLSKIARDQGELLGPENISPALKAAWDIKEINNPKDKESQKVLDEVEELLNSGCGR